MSNVVINRRPVFDGQNQVVAYRLDLNDLSADADKHTPVLAALNKLEKLKLSRELPAILTLKRSAILQTDELPTKAHPTVIYITSDIVVDEPLLLAMQALSLKGYQFAIDMAPYLEHQDALETLVSYITSDPLTLVAKPTQERVGSLAKQKKLLISDVFDYKQAKQITQLHACWHLGDFYVRPDLDGEQSGSKKEVILNLIIKLQSPTTTVSELEILLSQDVALCYKLLRLLNSAAYAQSREITSLKEAIVILGRETIRNYAMMLSYSKIVSKPAELQTIAMVRAKMCELLATVQRQKNPSAYFSVGLFSTFDALFDLPMSLLVEKLPLAPELVTALVLHSGPMGEALNAVIDYENSRWSQLNCETLSIDVYRKAYLQSLRWADEMTRVLLEDSV